MPGLRDLPKEILHDVFDLLEFKDKRSLVLIDRQCHEYCAARLGEGLGLLEMECFDGRHGQAMTVDYLEQHGYAAKNLLLHYGRPGEDNDWNRRVEHDFERILKIYRDRYTSEFIGFTTDTRLAPQPYRSIMSSLQAETLPKQFIIPGMLSSTPLAFLSGAVIRLSQDNGELADKDSRLFVRPMAPMDAVQAATDKLTRTVKEAVIFGRAVPNRGLKVWESQKKALGLNDTSFLQRLSLHNCDMNMLSATTLPASIKALTFTDNQDDRDYRIVSPYTEEHVLDQLLAAQSESPTGSELEEFIHIQNAHRLRTGYSTVPPAKLARLIQHQSHLAVACLHQDAPHGGRLADFALPSLKVFSYRDSADDIDTSQLKEFAKKAPNVQAWGGTWDSIRIANHRFPANILELRDALVDALKHMKGLNTIALFTHDQQQSLGPADTRKEQLAVRGIIRALDVAGLKIEWVHIIHRSIQTFPTSETPFRQNVTTFHAVRKTNKPQLRTRVERVGRPPAGVLEVRRKLGVDLIRSYEQYERQELGELYVNSQQLEDHKKMRKERREIEETLKRGRRVKRALIERHGYKRGAGFDDALDKVTGRYKKKQRSGH